MKRADVMVLGGAVFAASGALVLLDTAVSSVSPVSSLPAPLLAQIPVAPDPAFELFPAAATVSGAFESEGKQVPLPPGQWVVMNSATSPVGPATADGPAPVVSTVLLRLRGHHVDAAVLVQVNPPNASSNWGLARGCERSDFYHTNIRYRSDHDGACSYVSYVTPWLTNAPSTDEAWRRSMQQAVDNGWDVPRQWLEAAYRVSDPMDAMQVRYLFDPLPANAAENEITTDEVERLVAWSEAAWLPVANGFRGRLKTGSAHALGEWASTGAEPLSKAQKVPAPAPDRAAMKAETFRMVTSVTDFAVAYVYLGSLAAATTLSVAASVVSGAMYYANEAAWGHIPDPTVRLPDLPGVGIEQAGPSLL